MGNSAIENLCIIIIITLMVKVPRYYHVVKSRGGGGGGVRLAHGLKTFQARLPDHVLEHTHTHM